MVKSSEQTPDEVVPPKKRRTRKAPVAPPVESAAEEQTPPPVRAPRSASSRSEYPAETEIGSEYPSEKPRSRVTKETTESNFVASDDFGDGLEPTAAPPGDRRPRTRRPRRKPEEGQEFRSGSEFRAEIPKTYAEQDNFLEEVGAIREEPAEVRPDRGSSGPPDRGDQDGGRRRRRRRRRRGRGGPPQGQGQQGQRPPVQGRDRDFSQGRRQEHSSNGQNTPSMGTLTGVLELHPKGYGFLRDPKNNYAPQKDDPFLAANLIERHKLREGVLIAGEAVSGTRGQGPRIRNIELIDGRTPDEFSKVKHFDELTAINPHEQIRLEIGPEPVTMRVLDLLTPIGKGQRALLVAPPRSGKTMLLQEIAHSVSVNHPELYLIVLLIDERPEEVTEMRRRVRGEVIASSMDRDVESHVRIAQLVVERGKRIAEGGGEVFILLDSITRTARAFNKWVRDSGRTGSGGLDIRALDIPKKLFGTARRFEEGGSLTVAATALIETGSRMDDVIFQEFKGTGNMELVLSRQLADRRIWPALDIQQSGTRREEKILSPETLQGVTALRRSLLTLNPIEAMEHLIKTLAKFRSNAEFLARIRSIL